MIVYPTNKKNYNLLQIGLCFSIFASVNIIFCLKYISRLSTAAGIIVSVGYLLFYFFLFTKYQTAFWSKNISFILIGLFAVCVTAILFFIPKENLQVDRWDMICTFWDAVKEGISPYSARGSKFGNYPGPMPFYFILYYPFYLIQEPALLTIISVILVLVYYYKKYNYTQFFLFMILIFTSIGIYWDIFVRSSMFFNSYLFALFIFYMKDIKSFSIRKFYISALIGGLIFSTRKSFVLVLIPWFIFLIFREKIPLWKMIKWGIAFTFSFIATFIPFILIDPAEFLVMNPFVIQSSFLLPFYIIVIFLFLSFSIGFLCRKYSDLIFMAGIILFLIGIIPLILYKFTDGIIPDVSYTLFCFPFILDCILTKWETNNDILR